MKRMKILVVDDNPIHQQSARQTLGEHDLTVIGGHDEALVQLDRTSRTLIERGFRTTPPSSGKEEQRAWWEAFGVATKEPNPYWDAVLCDLLMPAGRESQGGEGLQYVGQEMPVGWSLAITAAIRGAKYVAVVTDVNHHNHPASAMLDTMNRTVFALEGARALFTNYAPMIGIDGTEKDCNECSGTGSLQRSDSSTYTCYYCKGSGRDHAQHGKDWAKVLASVMETDADAS